MRSKDANEVQHQESMALFARIETFQLSPYVLFAIAVFLIAFPLVAIRAYHFEEGLTVALARDVLDAGNPWYEPYLFGYRWMERPVLLSWIIALLSFPFGEVYQIVTRLPVIFSEYLGALLVYFFVRTYVGKATAIFGSLCFLLAPLLLEKIVTAESDVVLTVTEFAAFVIWWRGYLNNDNSLFRWGAIGLLLAATAMYKGPQPAGFFPLGVGAFLIWKRQWNALPGFVLAGVISLSIVGAWYLAVYEPGDPAMWSQYMRMQTNLTAVDFLRQKLVFAALLLLQMLPATIVLLAGFPSVWKDRAKLPDNVRDVLAALMFFICIGLVAGFLWPNANTRYMMPTLPAIAAIAAIIVERIPMRNQWPVRATITVMLALGAYQVVWNWIAAPAFSDAFARSRRQAEMLTKITASDPAPFYAEVRSADAVFAYLKRPVRYLENSRFEEISPPVWIYVKQGTTEKLLKDRSDLFATTTIKFKLDKYPGELSRIERKERAP